VFTAPAASACHFWTGGTPPVQAAGAFEVGFEVVGHALTFVELVIANGSVGVDFAPAGHAAHGIGGVAAIELGFSAAGSAAVIRYELTGEVRKDGILVDRLVRSYRRDTGELVGEQMTVSGKFKLHAGFVLREHYIIPIDPADDATDWLPPTTNRVNPVLAQDVTP